METILGFALVICFTFVLVAGNLPQPGGSQSHQIEAVDALKTIGSFEYLVSISDSDNDTIFECLSARRTDFDPNAQTFSFVWIFPSTGEEIPFNAKVGDSPGTLSINVDGDPTQMKGIIYYTDYENCVVGDMEYHGHRCILFTRREVKDPVPQDCIDHFVDTCGVIVPPHSRDLCPDGEGDF